MNEPGAVQGPLSAPARNTAGQAVFTTVQRAPTAPSSTSLSVAWYSALAPKSIQPNEPNPDSPTASTEVEPGPTTSERPRISNHSPKRWTESMPSGKNPL